MYIPDFWCGVIVGVGGLVLIFLVAALVQSAGERRQTERIMAAVRAKELLGEIEAAGPAEGDASKSSQDHKHIIEKIQTHKPMETPPSKPASKGGPH